MRTSIYIRIVRWVYSSEQTYPYEGTETQRGCPRSGTSKWQCSFSSTRAILLCCPDSPLHEVFAYVKSLPTEPSVSSRGGHVGAGTMAGMGGFCWNPWTASKDLSTEL